MKLLRRIKKRANIPGWNQVHDAPPPRTTKPPDPPADNTYVIVIQTDGEDDIVLNFTEEEYDTIIEAGVKLLLEEAIRTAVTQQREENDDE